MSELYLSSFENLFDRRGDGAKERSTVVILVLFGIIVATVITSMEAKLLTFIIL